MEMCVKGVAKGGVIATCIPMMKWINTWWFARGRSCVALQSGF